MLKKVLIANRGEIALRVIRACRELGLETVAVYSEADRESLHVRFADDDVCIGPAPARDSYLNIPRIIAAAEITGADAIHPGYGFLAENAEFAEICAASKITFIGPTAEQIRTMGDKAQARKTMTAVGVPIIPGTPGPVEDSDEALTFATQIGFPVIIKAAAGGGGKGMRVAKDPDDFGRSFQLARSEALSAFGNGDVYVEKYLTHPRHIEFQILGDKHGNVLHLGERDCSVQRRHQKLIEESPSPAVDDALRETMGTAAVALAKAVNYVGAGTVEFLLDTEKNFYFMEMNTRLQVEHPVTEAITGLDLVEWELRVAMGERFTRQQSDIRFRGHAIEARLCAEDPAENFLPQAGRIALWRPADGVRTDHALESGSEVSPFYDSMIAKVIAHGATRDEARERLANALDKTVALGVPTNKAFLAAVLRDKEFATQGATTDFL